VGDDVANRLLEILGEGLQHHGCKTMLTRPFVIHYYDIAY
jgi:hypothetical protein